MNFWRLIIVIAVALQAIAAFAAGPGDHALLPLHLRQKYVGEETGLIPIFEASAFDEHEFSKTKYFTDQERARHKISILKGRLFWGYDDKPFDTDDGLLTRFDGSQSKWSRAMFVMSYPSGEIYASNQKHYGFLHHSSFFGREDIAFAGTLSVTDGVLTEIRDWSGHFQPSLAHMVAALHVLKSRGLDLSSVRIETHLRKLGDYFAGGGSVDELMDFCPEVVARKWLDIAPHEPRLGEIFSARLAKDPLVRARIVKYADERYAKAAQKIIDQKLSRSIVKRFVSICSRLLGGESF